MDNRTIELTVEDLENLKNDMANSIIDIFDAEFNRINRLSNDIWSMYIPSSSSRRKHSV